MHHIENADCLDFLAQLKPDCVDSFVEDPPYGLAFMGKGWDHAVPGPEYFAAQLRVAKPGAHLAAFGGTRTYHRLACAIEDAGWELRDCLMWLYGSGFPKSHNGDHGGTALKPAWEPIILARKPFKTTVAKNYAAHGVGGLNIDATRITIDAADRAVMEGRSGKSTANEIYGAGIGGTQDGAWEPGAGRWPANVVLDPEAGAVLDAQTGTLRAGERPAKTSGSTPGGGVTMGGGWHAGDSGKRVVLDSGGASRFFYCAKASKAEREAGLEDFTPHNVNDGRDTSIDNAYQRGDTQRRNTHPTVKPIALMSWLCKLVTPPGGLVCDPFCGSGSTGVAAVESGFDFLGIEREPEFAALAAARVGAAA